jgi:hypothetical protein
LVTCSSHKSHQSTFLNGCCIEFFSTGFAGCKLWAPRVLLVATNANQRHKAAAGSGDDDDDSKLIVELMIRYETDLIIEPHLFNVECSQPMSQEMKTLKLAIGALKKYVCEVRTSFNAELAD